MGCFDSFYNKDKKEIQVKIYDSITGGYLNNYDIGDSVPTVCKGYDLKITCNYGRDYNVFPYTIDDYVILIRNGVFVDAVHYTKLRHEDVHGFKCYSKYGGLLKDINSVEDYLELKRSYV